MFTRMSLLSVVLMLLVCGCGSSDSGSSKKVYTGNDFTDNRGLAVPPSATVIAFIDAAKDDDSSFHYQAGRAESVVFQWEGLENGFRATIQGEGPEELWTIYQGGEPVEVAFASGKYTVSFHDAPEGGGAVYFMPDSGGSQVSISMDICVDCELRGANLVDAPLANNNLSGAILKNADLSGADLSGASLAGASLEKADLDGADLTDTDLRYTGYGYAGLANIYKTEIDEGLYLETLAFRDAEGMIESAMVKIHSVQDPAGALFMLEVPGSTSVSYPGPEGSVGLAGTLELMDSGQPSRPGLWADLAWGEDGESLCQGMLYLIQEAGAQWRDTSEIEFTLKNNSTLEGSANIVLFHKNRFFDHTPVYAWTVSEVPQNGQKKVNCPYYQSIMGVKGGLESESIQTQQFFRYIFSQSGGNLVCSTDYMGMPGGFTVVNKVSDTLTVRNLFDDKLSFESSIWPHFAISLPYKTILYAVVQSGVKQGARLESDTFTGKVLEIRHGPFARGDLVVNGDSPDNLTLTFTGYKDQ